MSANVGTIDRALRAILGLILIAASFFYASELWTNPVFKFGALIVGAVLVLTSVVRSCPLYRLIGVRTCQL